MKDWWIDIGIWLVGLALSIITIGVRNEMKTNQLTKTVYENDGSIKLVKVSDCIKCQDKLDVKFGKIDNKLDSIIDKLTCIKIKEAIQDEKLNNHP